MATKKTSILTAGANNHLTTAEEANQIATDFISGGILGTIGNTNNTAPSTGGFAVNAQSTPDMTVNVAAGIEYALTTPLGQNSQMLRTQMLSSENVTIAPNASGVTKYDYIYVKNDATNANTPDLNATNVATLFTSRSSNNVTDDGTGISFGELIAVVTVPNGASSITSAQIRDRRRTAAIGTVSSTSADWRTLSGITASFNSNLGGKEAVVKYSGVDLTGILPIGSAVSYDRLAAPGTQCMSFIAASSQYATKATPSGITFTTAFTAETWVKMNNYPAAGASSALLNRFNNLANNGGWLFQIREDGRIQASYGTAANFTSQAGNQCIPSKRWVHVAASVTVATKAIQIYVNGTAVTMAPAFVAASTTLTQDATSDLRIGAMSQNPTSSYLDGSLAETRLWSVAQSTASIQANMGISLVGNEANLVGLWPGNGNFNDQTGNANNLTSVNGAVATTLDNSYHTTEMGTVLKTQYSAPDTLVTVSTGDSYVIPNASMINPKYSTAAHPLGLPSDLVSGPGRTLGHVPLNASYSVSNATPTVFPGAQISFTAPQNCNRVRLKSSCANLSSASGTPQLYFWDIANNKEISQFNGVAGGSGSGLHPEATYDVVPGQSYAFGLYWACTTAAAMTWNQGAQLGQSFSLEQM